MKEKNKVNVIAKKIILVVGIAITVLLAIVIIGSDSSSSSSKWIKPGDTVTFNGVEYTFKSSYSNEVDDLKQYYIDLYPTSDGENVGNPGSRGPNPQKAYLVDITGEEIYSLDTWGPNLELIVQTKDNTFANGIAYVDSNEEVYYFQFV